MSKIRFLSLFSVLYLLFPLPFFAYGWLRTPFGDFELAIIAVFIVVIFIDIQKIFFSISWEKFTWRKIRNKEILLKILFTFAALLVWLILSGIGGFGYQTMDYLHHNALFKELIEKPWPLTTEWNGGTVPVVYYLAWYLPSAFMGKLFGWDFANVFMLIWAFAGVIFSFGWFLNMCAIRKLTIKKLFVILAIFCLAGGLDFVGYYLLRNNVVDWHNLFPLDGWSFLQYSSNTTLIYWVPQHTISAWLITGLILDCVYGDFSNLKYFGISLAGCLMASPFGVVGIVPFILFFLIMIWKRKQWEEIFVPSVIVLNLLAVPIAVIGFLYLTSNKFSFPSGFIWKFTDSSLVFWGWLEFFLVEIGFLASFVFMGVRISRLGLANGVNNIQNNDDEISYSILQNEVDGLQFLLFLISVFVLFLLPAYKMGLADDFVMRASIPSLFIFWSFISKFLIDSALAKNGELRAYFIVTACLVLVGFYNSLAQISISARNYHFGAPDEDSVLTVATGSLPWVVEQRLGDGNSFYFQHLGK